jgi:hypothetical protein
MSIGLHSQRAQRNFILAADGKSSSIERAACGTNNGRVRIADGSDHFACCRNEDVAEVRVCFPQDADPPQLGTVQIRDPQLPSAKHSASRSATGPPATLHLFTAARHPSRSEKHDGGSPGEILRLDQWFW